MVSMSNQVRAHRYLFPSIHCHSPKSAGQVVTS
jgi:hypothetical protein